MTAVFGRDRGDRDRGATLILSALSMIVVVIIAAIVVDLGHERALRRQAQSVSDLAVLAGTQALVQPQGAAPTEACEEALQFIRLNIENLPGSASIPCGDLAAGLGVNAEGGVNCDADTVRRDVTDGGTAAPYVLRISWPIPDADIFDGRISDPQGLREFDGHNADDQCDRFAVDVQIDQARFFSAFLQGGSLSGTAEAVARRLPYEDTRAPNLWLLEPHDCDVLKVAGGSNLVVGELTASGLITADSDGSACRNASSYVIGTEGSGNQIDAIPNSTPPGNPNGLVPPGEISLVAMDSGQQTCATGFLSACNPADISSGRIDPQPEPRSTRATRAPVDWRYNCKSTYPNYHGIAISGCPYLADDSPYIDLLETWVSANITASSAPPGWSFYGDNPSEKCKNMGNVEVSGSVVVTCDPLVVGNGDVMAFTGGNVVFDNQVKLSSGGQIFINQTAAGVSTAAASLPSPLCDRGPSLDPQCFAEASADAVWIYQREKGWVMTGGTMTINNGTFVQKLSSGANDFDSRGGGATWSAPTEGPFEALALWSGTDSRDYGINSSGTVIDLEGVFFTPEADFELNGGSSLSPQAAQFVSRRLKITGGADLQLTPLGIPLVQIPPQASVLIR